MKDYYEILEVSRTASKDIINKVFKIHMKANHPDLYQGDEKIKAEEKSKELTEAYNVLSDDVERAKYDESLKAEEEQNNSLQLDTILKENEYLKQVISKKDEIINKLTNNVYSEYTNNINSNQNQSYNNSQSSYYGTGFNGFTPKSENPYEGMSLEELQKLKREETKLYYKNIIKDVGIKLILFIIILIILIMSVLSSARDLSNLLGK